MIQKVPASMMEQSRTAQIVVPTSGQTVQLDTLHHDGVLILNPVGTLATLIVRLPADVDADVGEKREVIATQTITSFTLNGATTIVGAPTSMNPMSSFIIEKISSQTWVITPQS